MVRNNYKIGDKTMIYLPDGNLIKAKIVEIIPESKSKSYLVQFGNAYAIVTAKDILKKI